MTKQLFLRQAALLLLTTFLGVGLVQAQTFPSSSLPNGFPDADGNSGAMLDAINGLETLGESSGGIVFNIHIRVPVTTPQLNVEIFDGDFSADFASTTAGFWDLWDFLTPDPAVGNIFGLFPDVNLTGNTTPGEILHSMPSSAMTDSAWTNFFGIGGSFPVDPTDPLACEQGAGAEFCYYHLVVAWDADPGTQNLLNAFKVASNGQPFLVAGSTIGFIGIDEAGAGTVFPNTDYTGVVGFRALVNNPNGVCSLDVYDGDFDLVNDSDDPNTPMDLTFYPFPISSTTLPEDAIPGDPADDNPDPTFVLPPNINYTVSPEAPTAPYGVNCCGNGDPSGNREFELYRIASRAPGCPDPTVSPYDPDGAGPAPAADPDEIVDVIGQGFHNINVQGMDSINTNFLNVNQDVFSGTLYDFGDAPDSYQTLLSSGGPQHELDSRLFMGAIFDGEFDGVPGAGAQGDDANLFDDEDGVTTFPTLDADSKLLPYSVEVMVSNTLPPATTANLVGWIDFDGDGSFDADESAAAVVSPGDTLATLQFTVPDDLLAGPATTYARFRLTTDSIDGNTPGGLASDGEIEDYPVTIESDECIPCIEGPQKITFKIAGSSSRDQNEIIRVRVGDLSGSLPNPDNTANPVIFQGVVANGSSFMVDVAEQYRGQMLSITVQGNHHYYEYVKSKFVADCELASGDSSSLNGYLNVKVVEVLGDTGEICECVECEIGYAQITLKMVHWGSTRDPNEVVRVRIGDLLGEFSGSDFDAPIVWSGQVPNGGTIAINLDTAEFRPYIGQTLTVSVKGNAHPTEWGKARFNPDCELPVGEISGNSYIEFKVIDLAGDTGKICPTECVGDTSGTVKDKFSSQFYENNDGSRNWSGPWQEADAGGGGATGGYVKIYRGKLKLRKQGSAIDREVDLCSSDQATLSFKYMAPRAVDYSDEVVVEISSDGGSVWAELDRISDDTYWNSRNNWVTRSYDISEYASINTQVRFRVARNYGGSGEYFYVTWIKIESN